MNPSTRTAPTAPRRRWRQFLEPPRGTFVLVVVVTLGVLVSVVGYFVVVIGSFATDEELEAALVDLIHKKAPGGSVQVAQATDFDWDAVGIFGPYDPAADVSEAMGVRVPRGVTNWLQYDSHCLLIFRHADDIVAWARVPVHLVACDEPVVAPPAEARLRVVLDEGEGGV